MGHRAQPVGPRTVPRLQGGLAAARERDDEVRQQADAERSAANAVPAVERENARFRYGRASKP